MNEYTAEVRAGERFEFGKNWGRFLTRLDDDRIRAAEQSLRTWLETDDLTGKSFLDIGSGSGLFSLGARRLGARVHSFDYDPSSVACTAELRRRYFPDDPDWTVETASVLDREALARLGSFDIVYSWGVLHHTGAMWEAIGNSQARVAPGGRLFIAIYNDQGRPSRRWLRIKRAYNRLPPGLRGLVLYPAALRLYGPTFIRDLLRGRPGATWRSSVKNSVRGMDPWYNLVDWVGGLPFEVAKPEEILEFLRPHGFALEKLKTCGGGLGCNQFVFRKVAGPGAAAPGDRPGA